MLEKSLIQESVGLLYIEMPTRKAYILDQGDGAVHSWVPVVNDPYPSLDLK